MTHYYKTTHSKYDFDAILAFLIKYKQEHDGNSPTFRQIMAEFDIPSTSIISYVLDQMEAEGMIKLLGKRHRGIEVVGGSWSYEEPEPDALGW